MGGQNRFQAYLRSMFSRLGVGVDQEVEQELAFHVEMRTRELIARGLDPAAARRVALARFGSITEVGRRCRRIARGRERAMKRYLWLEQLRQDLLFAVRQLHKAPMFTAVVVMTIAIAVAANTTVFSVGNAVLLEPLPFPDPEQLVRINERTPEGGLFSVSVPNFADLREQNRSFTDMAAIIEPARTYALLDSDEAVSCSALSTTGSLFQILGVKPRLGRIFSAEEEQPGAAARVAVINHGLWQRRFGSDPEVVGQGITLDGEEWTVIGVLPADFVFPLSPDIWVPFDPNPKHGRGEHRLMVLGRLTAGVTFAEARADLDAIAAELSRLYPESNQGWGVHLYSFHEWLIGPRARRATTVLAAAVLLMLLLACANVSNLLIVRASTRSQEVATRIALGASRGRIIRQLLGESLLLALFGGGAGLALAFWAVASIHRFAAGALPRLDQIAVDSSVLVFTISVSLLAGLLAGLAPALQASRSAPAAALQSARHLTSHGTRRLQDTLVVAELALALMLLIGAGLLVKSYHELNLVDPGFTATQVLTAELTLPASRYPELSPQVARLLHEVLDSAEGLPQVSAAGATMVNPLHGASYSNKVGLETATDQGTFVRCQFRIVTPGFFRAMDIPVLRGRSFLSSDRAPHDGKTPEMVVVLSAALAERLWPGEEPVGKRLRWSDPSSFLARVVGVVGEVRDVQLAAEAPLMAYLDHEQLPWPAMTMVIRTVGDPKGVAAGIRRAVSAADPALPAPVMGMLVSNLNEQMTGPRLNTQLLGAFACMALVIAAIGVYGIISYRVTRRRRELGLRMALGAEYRDLVGLVLRQGLGLVGLGIAAGLLGALGLTRFLEHMLYGISALHAGTFAVVVLVFTVVAALSCFLPARRASQVDPVVALRTE